MPEGEDNRLGAEVLSKAISDAIDDRAGSRIGEVAEMWADGTLDWVLLQAYLRFMYVLGYVDAGRENSRMLTENGFTRSGNRK